MKKLLLTLIASFAMLFAYANGVVYFTNPSNWGTPYVWIWNDASNFTGGTWPGKAMTKDGDKWKYEWTGTGTPTKIIFSNNGSNQTNDLAYVEGGTYNLIGLEGEKTYDHVMCYFKNTNNWSGVYVYAWEPALTAGYPGQKLSLKSGSSDTYEWIVTTTEQDPPTVGKFLFNNNNDSQKTPDLSDFKYGATYLPTGNIEGETVTTTYYIIGDNINGVEDWNFSQKFTPQSDGTFVWEGTELGNNFKFTDTNGWGGGNYGSNGSSLKLGTAYVPNNSSSSGNIQFEDSDLVLKDPKVVLTKTNSGISVVITGTVETIDPSTLDAYLMGGFNDWLNNEDYKLTNNNNGTWTGTYDIPANSSFQIKLGNNWFGSAGGDVNVTLDSDPVTLKLNGNLSNNNYVLNTWTGGNITFFVSYENMEVTLTPEPKKQYPEGTFLIFEDNDWDALEENQFVDEGDSIYTLAYYMTQGTQFKVVCNNTVWGSDDSNSEISWEGQEIEIECTEDGDVFTLTGETGLYKFTFLDEDGIFAVELLAPEKVYLWGAPSNKGDYTNALALEITGTTTATFEGEFTIPVVAAQSPDNFYAFYLSGEETSFNAAQAIGGTSGSNNFDLSGDSPVTLKVARSNGTYFQTSDFGKVKVTYKPDAPQGPQVTLTMEERTNYIFIDFTGSLPSDINDALKVQDYAAYMSGMMNQQPVENEGYFEITSNPYLFEINNPNALSLNFFPQDGYSLDITGSGFEVQASQPDVTPVQIQVAGNPSEVIGKTLSVEVTTYFKLAFSGDLPSDINDAVKVQDYAAAEEEGEGYLDISANPLDVYFVADGSDAVVYRFYPQDGYSLTVTAPEGVEAEIEEGEGFTSVEIDPENLPGVTFTVAVTELPKEITFNLKSEQELENGIWSYVQIQSMDLEDGTMGDPFDDETDSYTVTIFDNAAWVFTPADENVEITVSCPTVSENEMSQYGFFLMKRDDIMGLEEDDTNSESNSWILTISNPDLAQGLEFDIDVVVKVQEPVEATTEVTLNFICKDLDDAEVFEYVLTTAAALEDGELSEPVVVDSDNYTFTCTPPVALSFVAIEGYNITSVVTTYVAESEEVPVMIDHAENGVWDVTILNGAPEELVFYITVEAESSDGIHGIGYDFEDGAIYNLQGIRVNNPAKGGIYIINGKKVLIQ